MSDFSSLNYCTIYECEGDVSHDMSETDCCFHTVTKDAGDYVMNNTYTIVFFKGLDYLLSSCDNNSCFLTKEQIIKYLDIIKGYVDFDYSITSSNMRQLENSYGAYDIDEEECECFILHLTLDGTILQHKFVLKLIRGLYEYPFNMFVLDIFKLMKHNYFKRYGLVNLYLFVSHVCYLSGVYANDDQALCKLDSRFIPIINKRFTQWTIDLARTCDDSNGDDWNEFYINDLTNYRNLNESILTEIRNTELFHDRASLCFWQDDRKFEERLKYYIKNLKYYK